MVLVYSYSNIRSISFFFFLILSLLIPLFLVMYVYILFLRHLQIFSVLKPTLWKWRTCKWSTTLEVKHPWILCDWELTILTRQKYNKTRSWTEDFHLLLIQQYKNKTNKNKQSKARNCNRRMTYCSIIPYNGLFIMPSLISCQRS